MNSLPSQLQPTTQKDLERSKVCIRGIYFLRGKTLADVHGTTVLGDNGPALQATVSVQILPGSNRFILLGYHSHS